MLISRLGDKLRVAGTAEFNGYNTDLNSVRCAAITERVRYLFPKGIIANSADYWTGLRPMTPSNVPLIGRAHCGQVRHGSPINKSTDATFDNLWLNTGHGTLGWTHACGSAKAISLLMQGEKPPVKFDFIGIAFFQLVFQVIHIIVFVLDLLCIRKPFSFNDRSVVAVVKKKIVFPPGQTGNNA